MLFNGNFTFFSIFIIFYVIQWESCNFSFFSGRFDVLRYSMGTMQFFYLFCKFPMLFNGKFVFCQFPMLFNGNLRLEKLLGGMEGRTDRRMDRRTDGWTDRRMDQPTNQRLEIHPCVPKDIGPLGPLPKKCQQQKQ